MILQRTSSEADAFDRFFELLHEYSKRTPKLVAEIVGPTSNTYRVRDGKRIALRAPAKIQLIKYTDDPGFFALYASDDFTDHFYPFLSWLHGFSGGGWIVHDEDAHAELQRSNAEWERELSGRAQ